MQWSAHMEARDRCGVFITFSAPPPLSFTTRSLSKFEACQFGYVGCLMNFRDQPITTLPALGLQESTTTMLSWLQEL